MLGQERLAASTINTVLLGQNLSFAPTGTKNAAGALVGLAFDYRITHTTSLFAAFEGTMMSDDSQTGVAQAGVRVAF